MKIAIPVFDGLTAPDAIGPYEVLSRVPAAGISAGIDMALGLAAELVDLGWQLS